MDAFVDLFCFYKAARKQLDREQMVLFELRAFIFTYERKEPNFGGLNRFRGWALGTG